MNIPTDITNPSAFIERFVSNNEPLLKALEGDKEFQEAFKLFQEAEGMNKNVSQDLQQLLFQDEFLPGEMQMGEHAYLDNLFQYPFSARVLRNGGKTEPARLVKNHRRLQCTEVARASESAKTYGWRLKFKNPDYVPTELEKQRLKEYTRLLVDTFFFPFLEEKANFGKFLGQCYEDYFDLDDRTIETRRSLTGKPIGLHTVDPLIVKHAIRKTPKFDRWDRKYNPIESYRKGVTNEPKYLIMKENGRIITATTEKFMNKFHFFTSTDLRSQKRGFSIVEQGIRILYGIISAITYNNSNFSNNRTPQGVLAFTGGAVNSMFIEKFKKLLYAYLGGAHNRHRLPVIGLPEKGDAKFVNFNMSSREMEFHMHMTYMGSIFFQLSGTNPEELSMASHESAMTGKKLFDQAPDGILQISRDKGFNTFLRMMSEDLDATGVFQEIWGSDEITNEFTGLVVEDERLRVQTDQQSLASTTSINDLIRREGGKPQTRIMGGQNIYDIVGINNPGVMKFNDALIQLEQQKLQALQGAQAAAEGQQQAGGDMPISPADKKITDKIGMPEDAN